MECKNTIFLHSIKDFNNLNYNTIFYSFYLLFLSVLKKECSKDCNMDRSMLNRIADHKLLTEKPSINLSANNMINAFIIIRNSPSVTIVIGKVKMTNMGFITRFNRDNTTATIIAVM